MRGKQISIYASPNDLLALLKEVDSARPLEFAEMGLLDQAEPIILNDSENLLPFTAYLAFDRGLGITVRPVPQRKGGTKYAVDPMENLHTIVLRSGGLLDEQRLIAGDISTATRDEKSESLYALFAKVIRRRFEKIKSYYVGPEAVQLLDSGARLMSSPKSPETYDLVR